MSCSTMRLETGYNRPLRYGSVLSVAPCDWPRRQYLRPNGQSARVDVCKPQRVSGATARSSGTSSGLR